MYYSIAGHTLEIRGEGLGHIPGFSLFLSEVLTDPILTIQFEEDISDTNYNDAKPLYQFETVTATYEFLSTGIYHILHIKQSGNISWIMKIFSENENYIAITNMNKNTSIDILRFAIWTIFGFAALHRKTVAIHASTVTYNNRSILFLGESGTGKSTQSQLWMEHIPSVKLLNDDSPFIRIDEDNRPEVWGSPWSGKTHCYKNNNAAIAAFVRLRQAPHNTIRSLNTIEAIAALHPSLPPIFASDSALSGHIHKCLSSILLQAPVYVLDCLPDKNAVDLVYRTLKKDGWL